MTKKKRIALAYLASFLLNGGFWLVYARALRQSAPDAPKSEAQKAATLKPLVLGQFHPLPPLRAAPPPVTARLAGKETQAESGGQGVTDRLGTDTQAPQSLRLAQAKLGPGRTTLLPGQTAAAPGAPTGRKTVQGTKGKSASTKAKAASARAAASAAAGRQDSAAKDTDGGSAASPAPAPAVAPALPAELPSAKGKEGDDREGQDDSKLSAPEKAAEDKKKPPTPKGQVALKVIKMWTPKPGQKFNLATSLNIVLPPTLTLVPGPPLTPEQLEEVQKLLRRQKLKHVSLDRKQLKKLIAAQRIAENTKKKDKPGEEGRKREAKREPKPRVPHPHSAVAHAPKPVKIAMARPRSPFTYKQWNSDMLRRWASIAPDPDKTPAGSDPLNPDPLNPDPSMPSQAAPHETNPSAAAGQPAQPETGAPEGVPNANPGANAAAAGPNGSAAGTPGSHAPGQITASAGGGQANAQPTGTPPGPAQNDGAAAGQNGTPGAPDESQGQPGATGGPVEPPGGLPGATAGQGESQPPSRGGSADSAQGQPGQPGAAGQPGTQGQSAPPDGQPGAAAGSPGASAGQPGKSPGGTEGQPSAGAGQPGQGQPGQGQPGQGQPGQGQPGQGQPGQGQPGQGQPGVGGPPSQGNALGQPGAGGDKIGQGQAGQSQAGANAGQPGVGAGQPGAAGQAGQQGMAGAGQPGQPEATAGLPGAGAGPPGQAGATGPQGMAGQGNAPGQPGTQPGGQPAGQSPGQGQPGGQGESANPQTAEAGLDSGATTGDGTGGGGVLSGEQNDGMTDTPDDTQIAAENTEATGFETPEDRAAPDLPSSSAGDGRKGIPGALILPPSPPMGTETGKNPTPRPVKMRRLTQPAGRTAARVSPLPDAVPPRQTLPPRKAVPIPVGMPSKPAAKPIPPALTVGSTSAQGTVAVVVLARPHLPIGTVTDTIDPPLPPAKGTPRARTLALRQTAARALPATRTLPPTESAPPSESAKKAPPAVRQAKNSQGIREGTEQPLPPTPLPDSDMEIGDGSGLKGDYYQGRRFDLFQFTKADPNINFNFTEMPNRSPSPKIPSGSDYTIRWTGKIAAKYSETYTIYATVDDGVRVWINHRLVLDDWSLHGAVEFSRAFTFKAGEQYPIKVEYLESAGGAALIYLYWSSPSQPKEYIPEDAFFYPLPSDEEELKKDKAPL